MERDRYRQRERQPELPTPDPAELLEQVLTMPGELGAQYNRFYQYSLNNQILLFMQGCVGPVATYAKWQELGRQVKKGSKAKSILRPVIYKQKNEAGEEESKLGGFKMVRCIFELNDTDGEPLPPFELPGWDPGKALTALNLEMEEFQHGDGNVMGYSHGNHLAVSPLAPYPLKTYVHEVAHIIHGHTGEGDEGYRPHRGVAEFQAETTAYLVLHMIGADDRMNASESRGYVQSWLRGQRPTDDEIKRVFSVTDKIRRAGTVEAVVDEEAVVDRTTLPIGAAALNSYSEGGTL